MWSGLTVTAVLISSILIVLRVLEVWFSYRSDDVELPETAPPPQAQAVTRRLTGGDKIVFNTFIQEKECGRGGCAICLGEYKDGETVAAIIACKHRYHAFCIKKWLRKHDTCPLCRTHV